MANRLARETSPYLLQHANNPVDWHPWGPEALARAKREDKPIFLSIGYSACHWCHVMEHESFEDEEIAGQLNDKFVCIKVDREERPDLDQIYMHAVQLLTGRGGWPMSVFLTPDLQPFFGGTYWPPRPKMGMPGFNQVILAVEEAWANRRQQAVEQAAALTEHLQRIGLQAGGDGTLGPELLRTAEARLEQAFDGTHGGFGGAPKFPHSMDLQLLLRIWRRNRREAVRHMVQLTLDKMARGGIYDHLGGGFARYAVDARWLVPHFEKMLYDNALLASAYLDGFLATGNRDYARIVRETLDYTLSYMTDPLGAFHSTEDADSEGVEGKFYVWDPEEIHRLLGPQAGDRFCYVYDVTEGGNFEGKSILNLPKTLEQCATLRGWDIEQLRKELAESRRKLLEVRDRRVRPGKDDKILVSWNALMIDSLARAAGALQEPRFFAAATRATEFIFEHMQRDDGRLYHCWRQGQAKFAAYLDDYAYLINALVTLYETGFEERWIQRAVALAEILLQHFADPQHGGFFYTADDHETLIARNKDVFDGSVPSGNSMAAMALLRAGRLCGRQDFCHAARRTLEMATGVMKQGMQAGQMLIALDFLLGPTHEIVVLGDATGGTTAAALSELRRRYLPNHVLACRQNAHTGQANELQPIFQGKLPGPEEPTVFVCQDFACQQPTSGPAAAQASWDQLAQAAD